MKQEQHRITKPYEELVFSDDFMFCKILQNNPDLRLADDTEKIILSADGSADDVSEDMKAFLHYVLTQEAETEFTKRLDDTVNKARAHNRWRGEYMTLSLKYQEMMEEGHQEGFQEGHREGLQEGLQQGIAKGEYRKLIEQIRKKMSKGKQVAQIADELEEDMATIEVIAAVFNKQGLDCPAEKVLEAVHK